MSQSPETTRPRRPIRLMLIEDDPVFRLGLVTALEQSTDLQVVFEADTAASALRVLQDWLISGSNEISDDAIAPDLVLLSLDLGLYRVGQSTGLSLCQELKALYPQLPVLLLSATQDPMQLAGALQTGAEGFCPKGTDIQELITAIRRVVSGQTVWERGMQTIAQALEAIQSPPTALTTNPSPTVIVADAETSTPLAVFRRNLRVSGIQQIDRAIATLNAQLQNPQLTPLDELFLAGRQRELRAARWLVNRILTPKNYRPGTQSPSPPPAPRPPISTPDTRLPISSPPPPSSPPPSSSPSSLTQPTPTAIRSIRAALFDLTAARLQTSLRNLTENPLEVDILKEEKKRELLYIILRKLEETLDDLRFSQVQPEQLEEKQTAILQDLWQVTTTDFFGKYYTLQLNGERVEIVDVLLQDSDIVQIDILSKIPLLPEFLAHLLFQTPLTIDDDSYAVGSVEAMSRMEMLLQNLIIQIANAVMQPLLNRFGNIETIKRTFYDKRLLSTREIERFRNNLSWRYRMERLFKEPTAIFESRYNLLTLQEVGITKASIYAPRNEELAELSGIPFAVTLALEARDAIAPRLRTAISFVGSGVVYVLTDVIGRGIGLIGRGIVKGIGNALQDNKFSRNSERSR